MSVQHILVIYDIADDRTRFKVADICMDYGLDRIQFSAFQGVLSRTHQQELMLRIRDRLGKRAGHIQLVPVADREWSARIEVSND